MWGGVAARDVHSVAKDDATIPFWVASSQVLKEFDMPHIEYQCNQCKKRFERVQLLGEEKNRPPCPACGSTDVRIPSTSAPLFEGIASFSSLASDRD
jgi:putative FmdB family regulatory protein